MKKEIVLTSAYGEVKVHIITSTICAYWQDKDVDVDGNGYSTEKLTKILFTNGQTCSYLETPEKIHKMLFQR